MSRKSVANAMAVILVGVAAQSAYLAATGRSAEIVPMVSHIIKSFGAAFLALCVIVNIAKIFIRRAHPKAVEGDGTVSVERIARIREEHGGVVTGLYLTYGLFELGSTIYSIFTFHFRALTSVTGWGALCAALIFVFAAVITVIGLGTRSLACDR